jgi:hypothetical protein
MSSLEDSGCSGQRQILGNVRSRPACPDCPGLHRLRPAQPPCRQPEPGHRISLDHVRRSAPRMPRTGDALHGRDRWHPDFYRTAGGRCLKQLQQVPRGDPQRRLRRSLSPVNRGTYRRHGGRAVGVGLTWWHESDRTAERGARWTSSPRRPRFLPCPRRRLGAGPPDHASHSRAVGRTSGKFLRPPAPRIFPEPGPGSCGRWSAEEGGERGFPGLPQFGDGDLEGGLDRQGGATCYAQDCDGELVRRAERGELGLVAWLY